MKRWLVFRGDTYYPQGGWRDFFGSFDERAVAEQWALDHVKDKVLLWVHIIDRDTGAVAAHYGDHLGGPW